MPDRGARIRRGRPFVTMQFIVGFLLLLGQGLILVVYVVQGALEQLVLDKDRGKRFEVADSEDTVTGHG